MIGFMHRDASDANQRQSSEQDQFGRVVHHAVKDIDIYRAPRDQRTRSLAAPAIISPFATGLKLPLVNRKHNFQGIHVLADCLAVS